MSDAIVYFAIRAGAASAVDLESGEIVWQKLVAADASVTLADGKLYALDRETGEKDWTATLDTHPDARIVSTPVLAPGGIIVVGVASSELRRDLADFTFRARSWASTRTPARSCGAVR